MNGEASGDGRKLVFDHLKTMYLEQSALARHQESQRSTVTTFLLALATAILGLFGSIAAKDGSISLWATSLSILGAAIGWVGFLLTGKLFERAQLHYSLSEGYLNALDALAEDALDQTSADAVVHLQYIKDANRMRENGVLGISRVGKQQHRIRTNQMEAARLYQHKEAADQRKKDFINPRRILVPGHNANAVWYGVPFAFLDLYGLWASLFLGLTAAGLAGTTLVAVNYVWRCCEFGFRRSGDGLVSSFAAMFLITASTWLMYEVGRFLWAGPEAKPRAHAILPKQPTDLWDILRDNQGRKDAADERDQNAGEAERTRRQQALEQADALRKKQAVSSPDAATLRDNGPMSPGTTNGGPSR